MRKIFNFIIGWFWVFLFIFILLKYVGIDAIKIGPLSFSPLLYSTITAIILVFSARIIKKIRDKIKEKIIDSGLSKEETEPQSCLMTCLLILLMAQIESVLLRSGLNISPPSEFFLKNQEIYTFLFFCLIINFFGLIVSLLLVKKMKYIEIELFKN